MDNKEVKVAIIESERGWGQRIDEIRKFPSMEDAKIFVNEYNSHNTKEFVPDWYMYTEILKN
jgi:hypothetical protein